MTSSLYFGMFFHAGAFSLPKSQRDENAAPLPPSMAPVLFAVVNVAALNQTPALHALPSLPAVAHIPPSLPAGLADDDEEDEEQEEGQEINPEDQWARMVANAPLPFPRHEVLVLQRAINDAGVARSMLQWTNMKTGRWESSWGSGAEMCRRPRGVRKPPDVAREILQLFYV